MTSIDEFAERAALEFEERQQESTRQRLNLSRKTVVAFIKLAFYSSLIRDEGRDTTVTMMCYNDESTSDCHFRFDSPKELSAIELAKLSHAVGEDCHLCCICHNDKIVIAGIQVTELRERRELGFGSYRIGSALRVSINGPGNIAVSSGGMALIYHAGHETMEALFGSGDAVGRIVHEVCNRLQPEAKGPVEGIEDVIETIVRAIKAKKHGGMLLFVEEFDESLFSSYQCFGSELLRGLVLEYAQSVGAMVKAANGMHRLEDPIKHGIAGEALQVAANTAMLEKCVRVIAQLSGVDGAIVLDYECRVLAFNAIIKTEGDFQSFFFIQRNEPQLSSADVLKNTGSRHKSALSFCTRSPKSIAIVISNDGPVSSFRSNGLKSIFCERGLRIAD